MKLPLQITSRNVSLSEAAAEIIREKAAKLETFYHGIMACRVLVDAPHRHKHQGVFYNVRLDITVPGGEIVVKREPNEDLYVAIRDSFDAARRQLQSFVKRQRGEVKIHGAAVPARVNGLDGEYADFPGGQDFHRDGIDGGPGRLVPEPVVRFIEEEAGEELQLNVASPRAGGR
jgi:ribosomal subunit interface protein